MEPDVNEIPEKYEELAGQEDQRDAKQNNNSVPPELKTVYLCQKLKIKEL